jgi:hypothetical protein
VLRIDCAAAGAECHLYRAQVDAAGVAGAVMSNNKLHLCGNGITVPPHSTMVSKTIRSVHIANVNDFWTC